MLFLRIPESSSNRRPSDSSVASSTAPGHRPRRTSTPNEVATCTINGQEYQVHQDGNRPSIFVSDDSGLRIRVRVREKDVRYHRQALSPPPPNSPRMMTSQSRSASYTSLTDALNNLHMKPAQKQHRKKSRIPISPTAKRPTPPKRHMSCIDVDKESRQDSHCRRRDSKHEERVHDSQTHPNLASILRRRDSKQEDRMINSSGTSKRGREGSLPEIKMLQTAKKSDEPQGSNRKSLWNRARQAVLKSQDASKQ